LRRIAEEEILREAEGYQSSVSNTLMKTSKMLSFLPPKE